MCFINKVDWIENVYETFTAIDNTEQKGNKRFSYDFYNKGHFCSSSLLLLKTVQKNLTKTLEDGYRYTEVMTMIIVGCFYSGWCLGLCCRWEMWWGQRRPERTITAPVWTAPSNTWRHTTSRETCRTASRPGTTTPGWVRACLVRCCREGYHHEFN